MKTRMLLAVAALSVGLVGLAGSADAHGRHHHRRGRLHVGVDLGVAHHYRVAPTYRYNHQYWDGDYGYYDAPYGDYDYGYSSYYRAPRVYADTYYVRTPRIVVRHHRSSRGHRRHHR